MLRSQIELIIKDIEKKMVFLVGPRQVGKTWLAKELISKTPDSVYLNYDRREDRSIIQNESWLEKTRLLVFDELHKMPDWKNYLKGIYDTKPDHLKILVTGSARLDMFRQSGDSLAGRFFSHRLMPFSIKELIGSPLEGDIDLLLSRGGFPEPLLAESESDAEKWRTQYVDGLIRTDFLELDSVHNLRAIQLVLELLRDRVGSPVSYNSIARDVQISPTTVKKYVEILESLYIVFRIIPYSNNISRSLLKEPKIYFFDTGMVKGDNGKRFENLMAISLLKHILARQDSEGKNIELRYIRNKEEKEVDFCLVENETAKQLIEVKYADSSLSSSLKYFHEKYEIPAIQIVKELKQERREQKIEIRRARDFLAELSA